MSYDNQGLGIAEMTFISLNYPEVWKAMDHMFDDGKDSEALELARKAIAAHNAKLMEPSHV